MYLLLIRVHSDSTWIIGFKQVGELENFVKMGYTELLLRKTAGAISGIQGPVNQDYAIQNSLLVFLLTTASRTGYSQEGGQDPKRKFLIQTIDSILQTQVNSNLIPGAVIQVKKDNRVIYRQAYGFARDIRPATIRKWSHAGKHDDGSFV